MFKVSRAFYRRACRIVRIGFDGFSHNFAAGLISRVVWASKHEAHNNHART